MQNIYLKLLELQQAESGLVLATVIRTVGSTPQKPGSSAIIVNGRLLYGTVGGGVVESKVQEEAKKCSRSGKSRQVNYLLNSDISFKEEAICGGEISILIDAGPLNHLPVFREIKKSIEKREPGVLITRISVVSEEKADIGRHWITESSMPSLHETFSERIVQEARRVIADGSDHGFLFTEPALPGEKSSSLFFIEPVLPLPRLIIAGAGHIGKALSHLGNLIGFEVTIIDNRPEFANPFNLPDADHIMVRDIGQAMAETEKSADSFFVIVTRGHGDDASALKPCIGSAAAYVGMIGSRSKIARMKADFIEKRWATEEQWNKIHTPIGLDIKSKTVDEIAISIAAELILVRNKDKR